ncbi:hypothetical protein NDU88_002377 [Pleurodeles waltl]|uniref:Uncharacterized protein n=1 Tax=Pleurodeles waltl TaxID=8319 RepID=A0AAV7WS61_PLEWA|nr:hypothetical protein NDU88_002377 [Pleurodeles waltl]
MLNRSVRWEGHSCRRSMRPAPRLVRSHSFSGALRFSLALPRRSLVSVRQGPSGVVPRGPNVRSSVPATDSLPYQRRHRRAPGACQCAAAQPLLLVGCNASQPPLSSPVSRVAAAHRSWPLSTPETPLSCPHFSPQLRAITDPRRGNRSRIVVGAGQSRSFTRPPLLQIRPRS